MRLVALAILAGCGRLGFTPLDVPEAPDAPAGSGLVAWYPMDDLVLGKATDASGFDHHGLCTVCPTVVASPRGAAYQFDSTQRIDVASTPRLTTTAGFTVAFWFWLDQGPATAVCPISKGFGTADRNTWQLCVTSQEHLFIETSWAPQRLMTGPAVVTTGRWYHVAIRWEPSAPATGTISLDGVDLDSTELGIVYDDSPILLGADVDAGVQVAGIEGLLDEVRIYDYALSTTEIFELAQM